MKKTIDFYIVDEQDDARFYARREEGFDAEEFQKHLETKGYDLANALFVNGKEKRFFFKSKTPKPIKETLIESLKFGSITFKQYNEAMKAVEEVLK